jgi:amino acid adenylation domain-containing protein
MLVMGEGTVPVRQSTTRCRSVIDLLCERVEASPEVEASLFVPESGGPAAALDYGTLDRNARAIAARLQQLGAAAEPVLLLFPPGLGFVSGFFGCLYAAAAAVPLPLPGSRGRSRLPVVLADCGARFGITTRAQLRRLEAMLPAGHGFRFEAIEEILESFTGEWRDPRPEPDAIALIQYTSGSTAEPRGVMVTYGNLLANVRMLDLAAGVNEGSTVVSWLPHYHDMGLMGTIIQPAVTGIRSVRLSPAAFLRRPVVWLETMTEYRAEVSAAPNFAYDLCVDRIPPEEIGRLDLSAWRVAFNSAEPVRMQTMQRFASRFAQCGFRLDSFVPAYGLAEATLFVTGGPVGDGPRCLSADAAALEEGRIIHGEGRRRELVASGRPAEGTEIAIVDPDALERCAPGTVGEIWVAGPGVAAGYFGKKEESDATFRAAIRGEGQTHYLRTGDLGFLDGDQLFVTGRIKDLIVIRGRNLYPQDVEQTACESHDAFQGCGCAAFSVPVDGEEQLVVAQEVNSAFAGKAEALDLAGRVREAVLSEFEVDVFAIALVRQGSLPRTTSGKLRRSACRTQYLAGELTSVKQWTPTHAEPANVAAPRSQELIEWLRGYAEERINSRMIDERRSIPPYIVLDFGNRGLFGLQAPSAYGGLGFSYADALAVLEQLAAIDLTLASLVGLHNALGLRPLLDYGTPRLREELLPVLASGRQLAAFALTEPAAGSNPRAIASTAVPDGDGWRLNGEKIWVGNGSWSGVMNVFVQQLDAAGNRQGISGFVLRQGMAGLKQGSEALTMGLRGMVQNSLRLDGVAVREEDMLGTSGNGLKIAQEAITTGRLGIGAISIGAMKRCAQIMARYAGRRTVATGRLLDHPPTVETLDGLTCSIAALEALVHHLARMLDTGCRPPAEAFLTCKVLGSELLWRAADRLVRLLGGRGYIESNYAPQILRDARLLRIFEGPSETLLHHLGHSVLAGNRVLDEFLSRELGAAEPVARLHAACAEVREGCENRDLAAQRAGELAAYTVLHAASLPAGAGAAWAAGEIRRCEQALRQVLDLRIPEPAALLRTIDGYQAAIGDLEQSLPGEEVLPEALLRRDAQAPVAMETAPGERQDIEPWIREWMARRLHVDPRAIDASRPLVYYGLDSLRAAEFAADVEAAFGFEVKPGDALEQPTLAAFLDLLQKRGQRVGAPRHAPPDPPHRHEPFPLRDIQHAYWVGRSESLEGGRVGCHVYWECDCTGLDLERLTVAWRKMVARHDMLRAIVLADGRQQILESVPECEIAVTDLRTRPAEEIGDVLEGIREERSHRVFAPEQWPLFEISATILDGRIRLHVGIDLLIVDGAGLLALLREWGEFYRQPDGAVEPLAYSFRDYVQEEIATRERAEFERSRDYWQARLPLAGPPDLPLAEAGEAPSAPRFVRHAVRLEPNLWSRLKRRGAERGLTSSALVCAAFADALACWCRRTKFTLTLTSFRRFPFHADVPRLVGDFTSTVPLEVDNSPATFALRADALQQQLRTDLEFTAMSGVEVLREQRKLPGQEQTTLPYVFTSFLGGSDDASEAWRWLGTPVWSVSQTPQVWMDCQVLEEGGGLAINLDILDRQFPEGLPDALAETLTSHLRRLAGSDAAWTAAERDLVPPEQLRGMRAANQTAAARPEKLLHELLLEQAAKQPDRPAVECGGFVLSYAQLAAASGNVAARLVEAGARPNELVAIVMRHGWEQVVACLAAGIAGAAYLPVDASLPGERIRLLLEDGEVRIAVTQPSLEAHPALAALTRVECLRSADAAMGIEPNSRRQTAEDLAYVIYTSGSSGRPKGVMISQRAAANTIVDINRRFQIIPGDRVLYISSLGFDLSVYDIFGTLAAGATIVIPEPGRERDSDHLLRLLGTGQVTVWNSVPALIEMLVEAAGSHAPERQFLRLVLLSGDWIRVRLPERIRKLFPKARVISLGGATEASIWSIYHPIGIVPARARRIPYGRPLANQTFHVLDARLEPRPVWAAGELYIGGEGLAKGYWRDPEKTAAHFVIHPRTGERLYRTGDLGRYLPNFEIDFLGREDGQVKLRGHRIELAEIEAVLSSHPDVAQAAVQLADGERDHKELVAYLVTGRARETALGQAFWQDAPPRARARAVAADSRLSAFLAFEAEVERLSGAYIRAALRELGLGVAADETWSLAALEQRCETLPRHRPLLRRWFAALAGDGDLEEIGPDRFRTCRPLDFEQPEALLRSLKVPSVAEPLIGYVRASGENLTGILRGQIDPLRLFFPDGSLEVTEALYQFNPVSEHVNGIAAAVVRAAAEQAAHALEVLEIGAGTGGTTAALLPEVRPEHTRYTFTDLSRFFFTQAEKKFAAFPFLAYGKLDINEDPCPQGYAPGAFDLIVAANVLHDARHLPEALGRVRELLSPGGALLLVEGTRNTRWQLITVGFIEGFNAFDDGRRQENLTLLSAARWREHLREAGFDEVHAWPDANSPLGNLGAHVLIARNPTGHYDRPLRAWPLEAREWKEFAARHLPSYMIPSRWIGLNRMPLTPNGKVQRAALPKPPARRAAPLDPANTPRSAMEQTVASVWREVLGQNGIALDQNFFETGGDSLLIVQVQSRLAEALGRQVPIADLFRATTVRSLAAHLENLPLAAQDTEESLRGRQQTRRQTVARRRERDLQRRAGDGQ